LLKLETVMPEFVKYAVEDQIAIVTLDRPEKLNALNPDFKQQIIDALAKADADKAVSVIILEASGRSFGVGFDIGGAPNRDVRRDDPLRWDPMLHKSLEMAFAPWSTSKPVVAAVQGHVLGGSCELAMMCDLTIAAEDAKFGEPEVRFSHIGPVMVMPWVIGLKRARELLYFGDMIDAKTALEYGMVNRVVPRSELHKFVRTYAKRLALISPEALRWAKRSINRGAEIAGFRSAIEAGVDSLVSLYGAKTAVGSQFDKIVNESGLKAALEWRAAQFRELNIE
jgi:enoyl-CoA hydratase/carnithine racemase